MSNNEKQVFPLGVALACQREQVNAYKGIIDDDMFLDLQRHVNQENLKLTNDSDGYDTFRGVMIEQYVEGLLAVKKLNETPEARAQADRLCKILGDVVSFHCRYGDETFACKGRVHGVLSNGKYEVYDLKGTRRATFEPRHIVAVGDKWITVVV